MPADKDIIEFPMQLQQFIAGQDFALYQEIFRSCDEMLDVFVGRQIGGEDTACHSSSASSLFHGDVRFSVHTAG
jgi:hypothetical protein